MPLSTRNKLRYEKTAPQHIVEARFFYSLFLKLAFHNNRVLFRKLIIIASYAEDLKARFHIQSSRRFI